MRSKKLDGLLEKFHQKSFVVRYTWHVDWVEWLQKKFKKITHKERKKNGEVR